MNYDNVQNLTVKKKRLHVAGFLFLLLSVFIPLQHITAQEFSNIHGFIKKLSSDSLYGRGYQHKGDQKAANLITAEFKKIGFKVFEQPVRFNLNEFPTRPNLSINGKSFVLGKEFLPDASTPSAYISFDELSKNSSFNSDSTEIQIPSAQSPELILSRKESLMHSLSGKQIETPTIHIKSTVWPDSITSVSYTAEARVNDIMSQNLIFFADSTRPFSHLILAHYDHLGTIGDLIFNGANDNASGVGMMLYLADTLQHYSNHINPLFVAFTAEEVGLIGSRYFHHFYKDWWNEASVILNFDMVASGDGQVGLVGAVESEELFNLLESIEKPDHFYFKPRPNSPISDHFWFIDSGLSGFYVYTGNGKQPYHHPEDDFESLDLSLFNEMAEFMAKFIIESVNN